MTFPQLQPKTLLRLARGNFGRHWSHLAKGRIERHGKNLRKDAGGTRAVKA